MCVRCGQPATSIHPCIHAVRHTIKPYRRVGSDRKRLAAAASTGRCISSRRQPSSATPQRRRQVGHASLETCSCVRLAGPKTNAVACCFQSRLPIPVKQRLASCRSRADTVTAAIQHTDTWSPRLQHGHQAQNPCRERWKLAGETSATRSASIPPDPVGEG